MLAKSVGSSNVKQNKRSKERRKSSNRNPGISDTGGADFESSNPAPHTLQRTKSGTGIGKSTISTLLQQKADVKNLTTLTTINFYNYREV